MRHEIFKPNYLVNNLEICLYDPMIEAHRGIIRTGEQNCFFRVMSYFFTDPHYLANSQYTPSQISEFWCGKYNHFILISNMLELLLSIATNPKLRLYFSQNHANLWEFLSAWYVATPPVIVSTSAQLIAWLAEKNTEILSVMNDQFFKKTTKTHLTAEMVNDFFALVQKSVGERPPENIYSSIEHHLSWLARLFRSPEQNGALRKEAEIIFMSEVIDKTINYFKINIPFSPVYLRPLDFLYDDLLNSYGFIKQTWIQEKHSAADLLMIVAKTPCMVKGRFGQTFYRENSLKKMELSLPGKTITVSYFQKGSYVEPDHCSYNLSVDKTKISQGHVVVLIGVSLQRPAAMIYFIDPVDFLPEAKTLPIYMMSYDSFINRLFEFPGKNHLYFLSDFFSIPASSSLLTTTAPQPPQLHLVVSYPAYTAAIISALLAILASIYWWRE